MRALLVAAALLAGTGCTTVRQLRDHGTLPVTGKAERTRDKDALDYSIAISIAATPDVVWKILTDAPSYPRWNSTVIKLDGTIALNNEIKLVAKVAPDRTFELKVSTFEPSSRMVWEDGGSRFLGVRNFTLVPVLVADPAGGATGPVAGTRFAMSETFSGLFLGMIEGSLPDFTADFEAFAADLKKASEAQAAAH